MKAKSAGAFFNEFYPNPCRNRFRCVSSTCTSRVLTGRGGTECTDPEELQNRGLQVQFSLPPSLALLATLPVKSCRACCSKRLQRKKFSGSGLVIRFHPGPLGGAGT